MALHPAVTLDISHTDKIVDLMEERADVAIRAGPLKNSSLIARKLGAARKIIVASPDYLRRHGEPKSIADLEKHCRIGFSYSRAIEGWPLLEQRRDRDHPDHAGRAGRRWRSDAPSGACRRRPCTSCRLHRSRRYRCRPTGADARRPNPGDLEEFYAVYIGQGGPLPARVRALLDFLAANVRL